MKIYVYRKAADCIHPWAEIEEGKCGSIPVHPADMCKRIRWLIESNITFATQSDIAISIIGWMIKNKEIDCPNSIIYVDESGVEHNNPFDVNGELILPWRETGFESIFEAGFYYRYS